MSNLLKILIKKINVSGKPNMLKKNLVTKK